MMSRIRTGIVLATAAIIAVLLLFPPFFGMDTGSNGRIHAYIGHHARWSPPPPGAVYEALRARAGEAGAAPGSAVISRACVARVNRVRLALETILVLVLAGIALVVPWRGTARRV